MKVRDLFADERAVSPVIGVVLVVAATVVLLSLVGAMVLGNASSGEAAPSASFNFSYNGTTQVGVIGHDGGEAFTANNTHQLWYGFRGGKTTTWSLPVSAGDVARICKSDCSGDEKLTGTAPKSGDRIVVVWVGAGGDTTATVGEWTA